MVKTRWRLAAVDAWRVRGAAWQAHLGAARPPYLKGGGHRQPAGAARSREQAAADQAGGARVWRRLHRMAAARCVERRKSVSVLRCPPMSVQHHPHARERPHRSSSQQQMRQLPLAHVAQVVFCLYVRAHWQHSKTYAPFRSASVLAQHRSLTGRRAASPEVGGQPGVRLHAQHCCCA